MDDYPVCSEQDGPEEAAEDGLGAAHRGGNS